MCYTNHATGRGMRGALRLAPMCGPGPSATCSKLAALGSGPRSLEVAMADEEREEWRAVPGMLGYEVSDLGRVRTWKAGRHPIGTSKNPRLLRLQTPGGGMYFSARFVENGKARWFRVHRLVLEAFIGPCPPGMQCRHLNGKPQDNRLANLSWGTQSQNYEDRVRHGTDARGVRHGQHVLTAEDVRTIRVRASSESYSRLATEYGVDRKTLIAAAKGVNWSWITDVPPATRKGQIPGKGEWAVRRSKKIAALGSAPTSPPEPSVPCAEASGDLNAAPGATVCESGIDGEEASRC